jgi:hypothetical protein
LKSTNDFKNEVFSLIAKEEIEKELVEDLIWEYKERTIRDLLLLLANLELIELVFLFTL